MPVSRSLLLTSFLLAFSLLLYELLLTRLFAVVLFADFAHLALALALCGIAAGALAQHLRPSLVPAEGLERRLAALALLQGALALVGVLAVLYFPVLKVFETPPAGYPDRVRIMADLLNPVWFAALLPTLAAPFAASGLAFAGLFQRRKESIARLYAADLIGAAAGAAVFLPLLGMLAGPDVAFVIVLASASAALGLTRGGTLRAAAGVTALAAAILLIFAARGDVLRVRQAAGFAEEQIVYTRWTPLTRLSVLERPGEAQILLDNASASLVVQTPEQLNVLRRKAHRATVWQLVPPPARGAIIAASAGPEVAVAQSFGHTQLDAIDIASEIFEIVAERWPDDPYNPYIHGDTRRVHSDGRAAIRRAEEPYDVIQMVHANLWSSAGLLSNVWSPALLETTEAFEDYFANLSPDGVLSFAKGDQTDELVRAAAAALRARGVKEPWRCIAYFEGDTTGFLARPRPWTDAERAKLEQVLAQTSHRLVLDPGDEKRGDNWKKMMVDPPLTDDHPWQDTPAIVGRTLSAVTKQAKGESQAPLAVLWRSIVVQCVVVLGSGLLLLALPWALRGRTEMARLRGAAPALGYIACLGYGYLAVETVLIHALVLFVGHPTYAITVVVLSMLVASGLGSLAAERIPPSRLRFVLAAVVILGIVQAFAVPPLLHAAALTWPLAARCVITGLLLTPLGFAMGMPFPLAMRALPDDASALVPWAWAINGWMSVVASLGTVLVARMWGYTPAFVLALGAYAVAALLAGSLEKVKAELRAERAAS